MVYVYTVLVSTEKPVANATRLVGNLAACVADEFREATSGTVAIVGGSLLDNLA
jgi:hypothetical protein